MFQQRHFEAIAQIMQEIKPSDVHQTEPGKWVSYENNERARQWVLTVNALSTLFARHNSNFQLGRFERACEPGANVKARKASNNPNDRPKLIGAA